MLKRRDTHASILVGIRLVFIAVRCCFCIVPQEGRTVLHIAAGRGDEGLCSQLIEAGAALDRIDQVGLLK